MGLPDDRLVPPAPWALGPEERRALADALGETPETIIPVDLLLRGRCDAYVAGTLPNFDAAVVQEFDDPTELFGFGPSPEKLWELLKPLRGWTCVDVSLDLAPKLGWVIREETGKRVNYYGDVYYTLTEPVAPFTHPDVRRLTLDDIPIIEASIGVRRMGVSDWKTVLSEGFAAGAVVSDEIVATAVTGPLPERYSDIGVDTAELWRRRGFATAAAAIVARLIQESGRVPVWSCGEDNMPSQRVAEKLGFREVSRWTYVVPDLQR